MCMSPHEMSSARIEQIVANFRASAIRARAEGNERYAGVCEKRADDFEAILKERANDGTYHTDGVPLVLSN